MDPKSIFGANLTLWLLASKGLVGGTPTGSPITRWNDQSGHSNDFSGPTGPVTGTDPKGNASLLCDPAVTTGFLSVSGVLNWAALITQLNWTVWWVWAFTGNQGGGAPVTTPVVLCDAVNPPHIGFGADQPTPGNEYGFCYSFDTGTAAYVQNTTAQGPLGVEHYCIATMTGGVSLQVILDGVTTTTVALTGPPSDPMGMQPQLFRNNLSSFAFWKGWITEMATVNISASAGQIGALEKYLRRYGF